MVRSRAAAKHYSSGALPHVPGIDGVGTTDDGQTVYFSSFATGSLSEYMNMPKKSVIPLPQGLGPVQTAGSVNPAMSSWMAFKSRTINLPREFTVLILGATSASGRVAIPLARSLGAKRIIGAARNKAALDILDLDDTILIDDDASKTDFSTLGDVDVVLDYVFGPLAAQLFDSLKTTKPVQYVHVGALSMQDINLSGAALRSKNLTIRGSGPGAWSPQELNAVMPELLQALKDVPEQTGEDCKTGECGKGMGKFRK